MERSLLLSIRAGAFLLLLMPLIVTGETIFPYIVGKALFSRAVIEVLFGLWLVLIYQYPSYRPRRSWILIAFTVYVAVAVLAGIFGVSFQRSLWSDYRRMQGIVDLAHWLVLIPVLATAFRSIAHWRLLLSLNLAVSLVVSLLGVAQQTGFRFPFDIYQFLVPQPRVDSTLGHPAWVGAYMLNNILVGLGLLLHSLLVRQEPPAATSVVRRRRRERKPVAKRSTLVWLQVFWVLAVGFNTWALLMSGTRGAFVGLMAGLVAFAFIYLIWGKLKPLRLLSFSLLGLVVLVGLFFLVARTTSVLDGVTSSNVTLDRLATMGPGDPSIKGRVESWSVGFHGFADKPILGWGPENYDIIWGRFFQAESGVMELLDQAHNKPLEELATKGIIGLLSYLLLWGAAFWVILRAIRRQPPGEQLFSMFVGAALVAYVVQNLFLFDTPATFMQAVLLLGFVVSLELRYKEAENRLSHSAIRLTPLGRLGKLLSALWGQLGGKSARTWGPLTRPNRARRRNPPAAFGTEGVAVFVLLIVLCLVSLAIYFGSYRPYHSASSVLKGLNPTIPWEERFGYFDQSFDSFSPLANFPRLLFLTHLRNHWETLTEDEARTALAMVERQAAPAIKGEPQVWRLYVALGRIYYLGSSLEPSYLEQADLYTRTAIQLAPDIWMVTFVDDEDV